MFAEIAGYLAMITLMAYAVETIVEALFGRVIDNIPTLKKYRWTLVYIAVLVGIAGAWVYRFDLISLLGKYFGLVVLVTWFGITITGIMIGMGAAYIHQVISQFFPSKNGA